MARTLRSDRVLFSSTLLLVAASVIMVYSASAVQLEMRHAASYYFLAKQLAWAVLGLIVLLGTMRLDYHVLRRPAIIWTLVIGVTLALMAVFAFPAVNHAHRWISIGSASLQPSEIAKLVAIIFTAALLERRMHRINDVAYALAPVGIV